ALLLGPLLDTALEGNGPQQAALAPIPYRSLAEAVAHRQLLDGRARRHDPVEFGPALYDLQWLRLQHCCCSYVGVSSLCTNAPPPAGTEPTLAVSVGTAATWMPAKPSTSPYSLSRSSRLFTATPMWSI